MRNLIYEDKPRYDLWLKLILGGVLLLTLVLGVVLLSQDREAALVMFGVTLFDALLFNIRELDGPELSQVRRDLLRSPFSLS